VLGYVMGLLHILAFCQPSFLLDARRPPTWGPLFALNSQEFLRTDFKTSAALRPMMIG
jgi:hypothetical protein